MPSPTPLCAGECENKFARFPAVKATRASVFFFLPGVRTHSGGEHCVSLKAATYRKDNSARVRDEINVAWTLGKWVWRSRACSLCVLYSWQRRDSERERLREESAAVPRSIPSRVVSKSVLGRHGNHRVVDVRWRFPVRAAAAAAAAPWCAVAEIRLVQSLRVERAHSPFLASGGVWCPISARASLFRRGNAPLTAFW